MLVSTGTFAAEQSAEALLAHADEIKAVDQKEFIDILDALTQRQAELSGAEREQLSYLRAWQRVYAGQYGSAIRELKRLTKEGNDPIIRFRSRATLVNVLAIARQYRDAFSELSALLEGLPQVSDPVAREQAQAVAALLYNQVEQFELGLMYAQRIIEENWAGRGLCRGGQLRLEALYKSGKLSNDGGELDAVIDACLTLEDTVRANIVRTYLAKIMLDRQRYDAAVKYLSQHHEEVRRTRYPRLISEFDALLAQGSLQLGDVDAARRHAVSAMENSVREQFTEPLITAYRVLYALARIEGDNAAALSFHEKYAAADKGYIDDVSARQLAYERVRHETLATQLQIDSLNKQTQVLKLQRENSRLYIALLISVLAFILSWAYKTKRSQVHFMKLSQRDGLTGIANRPHFMDQAEQAIAACRKAGTEVSVVLFDLDHFKRINDRCGHAAGDFVLKETAAACQAHLRTGDIFGRIGGEEFGVVLASCEQPVAQQRCEELRRALMSITAPECDPECSVSASFGIACASTSGYELRALLDNADSALYRAKYAGRNCVMVHDPRASAPADTRLQALDSPVTPHQLV